MRSIHKAAEPRELIQWKAANVATPHNLVYGGGDFPAEILRETLLAEQFHLCAYTLRSLKSAGQCRAMALDTRFSCHVEHLLPQSRKVSGEDIDYQNMVACYPPSQSNAVCEFGAKCKDDFDPSSGKYIDRKRMNAGKKENEVLAQTGQFISPLSPAVDQHLQFDERGGVIGLTSTGRTTIKVLKLDHKTLVHDRAAVISGYLQPKGKKVTAQAARRLAQSVLQPDAQQRLPAYCVAIAQAAMQHAQREERRAVRMKNKGPK